MTKQEAISELTRAAELCPTTPLAEACRMAVNAMMDNRGMVYDCTTCRHADRMPNVYPCIECHVSYREPPSKWEAKEE